MKNFLAKTYKIKFNGLFYLNFQFTCLIIGGIARKAFSIALKEKMLRDFDVKRFLSLFKQIEIKDSGREETDGLIELELTEKEIRSYLCLAIFVSKIADSKYFIFMKNFLPAWEEKISQGIDIEHLPGKFKKAITLEGFSEFFARDVKLIARLATMRFRNKPAFTGQVASAFNYALT